MADMLQKSEKHLFLVSTNGGRKRPRAMAVFSRLCVTVVSRDSHRLLLTNQCTLHTHRHWLNRLRAGALLPSLQADANENLVRHRKNQMPNSFSFHGRKMTLIVIICVASLEILPKFQIQTEHENKFREIPDRSCPHDSNG